jgi:hypothetical protein
VGELTFCLAVLAAGNYRGTSRIRNGTPVAVLAAGITCHIPPRTLNAVFETESVSA